MPSSPSFQPRDPGYVERVRASFGRQTFMRFLGAELTLVEPGYCEVRLPFRGDFTQQHGYFHAGTLTSIADSAGGYAGFTLMGADDSVLAVEFKVNLLTPARGELAIARARVVKAGRTLTVCQVDVSTVEAGKETLCAIMQQTLIRLADRPDL
ncbi:MAG TPA: PaaI family thioesterase [Thermoanaerobaculia bacterium]|nr:PaaI family thioesterase [Thermoanaerobaculia bacterium]